MSFAKVFDSARLARLVAQSESTSAGDVQESLRQHKLSLTDFARLISPAAANSLEDLGRRARQLTQQRFGKVIRLFAPLYVSNECINNCKYCGFSRDNTILRVTLTLEEIRREAEALLAQGFRNVLLVSGEHPKFVSNSYLRDSVGVVHELVPSVS